MHLIMKRSRTYDRSPNQDHDRRKKQSSSNSIDTGSRYRNSQHDVEFPYNDSGEDDRRNFWVYHGSSPSHAGHRNLADDNYFHYSPDLSRRRNSRPGRRDGFNRPPRGENRYNDGAANDNGSRWGHPERYHKPTGFGYYESYPSQRSDYNENETSQRESQRRPSPYRRKRG